MYGINHLFKILLFIIISHTVSAQNDVSDFYLFFDSSSKELFEYEVGNGEVKQEKVYRKEIQKSGDRIFYIGKELFRNSGINSIDSYNIKNWTNYNISDISDLKKTVNETNPLYPYKVFPNLFLLEKTNDSIFLKYKVKWEYYIE